MQEKNEVISKTTCTYPRHDSGLWWHNLGTRHRRLYWTSSNNIPYKQCTLPSTPSSKGRVKSQPNKDESAVIRRVKVQALMLMNIWIHLRSEHLTRLRKLHKPTGNNIQQVMYFYMMTPQELIGSTESLIRGNDGLTWAANVCISSGKTAHPITRLYPLEVAPHSVTKTDDSFSDSARESVSLPSQLMITEQPRIGTPRKAATRAHKQLSNLSVIL